MNNNLKKLPVSINIETKQILKKSIKANKSLARLNGIAETIPNQNIIINSLVLQEAKDSSEIENIITTHDELYISTVSKQNLTQATKEVNFYAEALLKGFSLVKENNLLLIKQIIKIQSILENNNAGIRKQAGTVLKDNYGKTVYTPPQSEEKIRDLLSNLEKYINEEDEVDPLIKMAIIHYQFESIHPFYDGNGRTGRILNILYLVLNNLLEIPILYLSRFLINHKSDYYRLLREVGENEKWEEWILYMLEAVEVTSNQTIELIKSINILMQETQQVIQKKANAIYSKDLLEILFIHPYTKIDFLIDSLKITRKTASKYLNILVEIGVVEIVKIKNSNFYINIQLFDLLKKGIN